jgi:hypothetical protein
MTRWKIDSTTLDEREKDYSAGFTCHNMDTGKTVDITLRQDAGCPASDLIQALAALAQLLMKVNDEETTPDPGSKLH